MSKITTLPYDIAAQLRTPEEQAAYLDAWRRDAPEDAAGIARAVADVARAEARSLNGDSLKNGAG